MQALFVGAGESAGFFFAKLSGNPSSPDPRAMAEFVINKIPRGKHGYMAFNVLFELDGTHQARGFLYSGNLYGDIEITILGSNTRSRFTVMNGELNLKK